MTDGAASEAALIATFYGPRDEEQTHRLHGRLYRSFAQAPEASAIPDHWVDPSEEVFLDRFAPPGRTYHDTTIIQLALNAPGGAAKAWEIMRRRLEDVLLDGAVLDGNWGYTVIYQAELNRGVDADSVLREVLPSARRLHSPEDLSPLAATDVPGGRLWLLRIPDGCNGSSAATVYVALGPSDQAEMLLDVLYGPNAALLESDLIAHKSYYQMLQYRGGDLERWYEDSLDSLRKTTNELLKDLGQRQAKTDKLGELAREYDLLSTVTSELKVLRIALLKQSHNYDRARVRIGGGDVIEFHREQLETAILELELKSEEFRDALEVADKAVSVAQVQVDKAQENRQRDTQVLLAVIGVALAVPQVIDREVAGTLLGRFPENEPPDHSIFALLGIQLAIILAVTLVVVSLVYFLNIWRKQ